MEKFRICLKNNNYDYKINFPQKLLLSNFCEHAKLTICFGSMIDKIKLFLKKKLKRLLLLKNKLPQKKNNQTLSGKFVAVAPLC